MCENHKLLPVVYGNCDRCFCMFISERTLKHDASPLTKPQRSDAEQSMFVILIFVCGGHTSFLVGHVSCVARWHSGRVTDLQSLRHGFESKLPCCRVQTWTSC